MWYGLFWNLGINKSREGSMEFVSYNLKLFLRAPWSYMGPQRRGTTYTIWRKYFDFVFAIRYEIPLLPCRCPQRLPVLHTHPSQHISAQLVCSCLMRCCSISKAVGIRGTFTASFKNLTVSDLTPCNRSHTSNPFSRKHCVEIGTEPCVEMWRCTILLENHGTVVLMLQLWRQTVLKLCRDGKRGETKYLYVTNDTWQRGMRNCQEGIFKIRVICIHVLFCSGNHQYMQPFGTTLQTDYCRLLAFRYARDVTVSTGYSKNY